MDSIDRLWYTGSNGVFSVCAKIQKILPISSKKEGFLHGRTTAPASQSGVRQGPSKLYTASPAKPGKKGGTGFILKTLVLIVLCTGVIFTGIFAVYVATCVIPNAHVDVSEISMDQSSVIFMRTARENGKSWKRCMAERTVFGPIMKRCQSTCPMLLWLLRTSVLFPPRRGLAPHGQSGDQSFHPRRVYFRRQYADPADDQKHHRR